jgi:hypothetical protein
MLLDLASSLIRKPATGNAVKTTYKKKRQPASCLPLKHIKLSNSVLSGQSFFDGFDDYVKTRGVADRDLGK